MHNCERIDEMLDRMRGHKRTLTKVGEDAGLTSITNNSLDDECGRMSGLFLKRKNAHAHLPGG